LAIDLLYVALAISEFTGYTLDILARAPLWKYGLDYRHGTGHGVGSYLCVHEGKLWDTSFYSLFLINIESLIIMFLKF